MRRTLIALTLAAIVIPTASALADDYGRDYRRYDGEYDRDGRYREPRRDERARYDRDYRSDCKRGNGTTGLLLGGAAGALLGHEIDGGRNHTAGTVVGAAGGALVGRQIDRGDSKCR